MDADLIVATEQACRSAAASSGCSSQQASRSSGPQQGAYQPGRTGIEPQGPHQPDIIGERRRRIVEQPGDAGAPLAGALGRAGGQIVAAGAGMGVEHETPAPACLCIARKSQTSIACLRQSPKLPAWKAWR